MGRVSALPDFSTMILIAQRQLCGAYGKVPPGATFELDDQDAIKSLLGSGLATMAPVSMYETKVIIPAPPLTPVVVPESFRHLYMPNAEPAGELSDDGDPVLPDADVEPEGTPDPPRRRRGRPRKVRAE